MPASKSCLVENHRFPSRTCGKVAICTEIPPAHSLRTIRSGPGVIWAAKSAAKDGLSSFEVSLIASLPYPRAMNPPSYPGIELDCSRNLSVQCEIDGERPLHSRVP